ncbi:MAG: hypothetical protein Q7T41_00260 [Candidatus Saccharibacteria bacterium]|nr:hypothetical protein [Candidatus Saccharibacteria bacterium]
MVKLESIRILKKLDGFSVLLAMVMASAFQSFFSVAYELSAEITGWLGGSVYDDTYMIGGMGTTWQDKYLNPFFNMLIWLVAIELVLQLVKYLKAQHKKK